MMLSLPKEPAPVARAPRPALETPYRKAGSPASI